MMGGGASRSPGRRRTWPRRDADFDSVLLDYKAKGTTIELVGTEPINGKPAYHLKITKKNGLVQHYYLDVEPGSRSAPRHDVEQDGEQDDDDDRPVELSDGRRSDMPFTMKQSLNGTPVAEITISKWEVNIPVDDDLFKMPGKN